MNINMFPFTEIPLQPSFKKPSFQLYDQIQNPIISKHDDSHPFFSNFPSPFFDEHELLPLNQILPNITSKPANPSDNITHTSTKKISHPTKKDPPKRRSLVAAAAAPRKRTGKKDRHSKICTAQGIRDRRMRLSLQVARKFFDLQDMLGYDKASKTIEWLFNKSKRAIKDLAKDVNTVRGNTNVSISDGKSESFVSECEVVSGIEENYEIKKDTTAAEEEEEEEDDGSGSFEKKYSQRSACKPNTRESREKARERARCRTEEKMMGKRVEDPTTKSNDLEKLGSFDGGDDQEGVSAYEADYSPLLHPPTLLSDEGTIEKLLGSSSSDYANTNFMGFLGSWDLMSNDRINYALTNIQASNSVAGYCTRTWVYPVRTKGSGCGFP